MTGLRVAVAQVRAISETAAAIEEVAAVARGRARKGRGSWNAVTVPGPEVERLCEIARENALHMVIGLIERAGSSLYCGAVTIDDEGRVVGSRRKVMPTASERLIWAEGDGSTFRVSPTRLGRLATAICWENPMPALRMNFYAQLDLDQVTRGGYDFDATGHYSRPDIFTLAVDTRARQPVEWNSESPNARDDVLGDAR